MYCNFILLEKICVLKLIYFKLRCNINNFVVLYKRERMYRYRNSEFCDKYCDIDNDNDSRIII